MSIKTWFKSLIVLIGLWGYTKQPYAHVFLVTKMLKRISRRLLLSTLLVYAVYNFHANCNNVRREHGKIIPKTYCVVQSATIIPSYFPPLYFIAK